jgi:hypothetical protein
MEIALLAATGTHYVAATLFINLDDQINEGAALLINLDDKIDECKMSTAT